MSEFDQLEQLFNNEGADAMLEQLAQKLAAEKRYSELFETRKLQVRRRLGLPPLYGTEADDLSEDVRRKLEDGLLDACREVGSALMSSGQIREGWMYLRPLANQELASKMLRDVEIDDENFDDVIEIALSEGVDPAYGYQLVLEHNGTCNAITAFDTQIMHFEKKDRQKACQLLVKHVHDELVATLKADIAQQSGSEPTESSILDLVKDRDWLFTENAYHLDTTHLASTVRFARELEDTESLRLALDLTEYGRRLSSQFQYEGEEPFAEMYPSHALFFSALCGEKVDEAVDYFREKAMSLDSNEVGTMAVEVYVDLLSRLGRYDDAISATLELMPSGMQSMGIAPSLMDLAQRAGSYDKLFEQCRAQDDLFGFAAGLVLQKHS